MEDEASDSLQVTDQGEQERDQLQRRFGGIVGFGGLGFGATGSMAMS